MNLLLRRLQRTETLVAAGFRSRSPPLDTFRQEWEAAAMAREAAAAAREAAAAEHRAARTP